MRLSAASYPIETLHEPGHLLFDGHVAVVQHYGVVGLAQRRDRACHVGLVACDDVGPDLLERYGVAFGQQFVVAAPGPDFRDRPS